MKVFKKALCTALVITMTIGLVACGEKGEENGIGVQNTENKLEVAKEESAESIFSADSSFSISGLAGNIKHFRTVGENIYIATYDSKQLATGSDASESDASKHNEDVPKDNICHIYKAPVSGGAAEAIYETSTDKAGEAVDTIIIGDDGNCYFITSKDGNDVLHKISDGEVSEVGDAGKLKSNGEDIMGAVVDNSGNIISTDSSGLKVFDASLNEISSTSSTEILSGISLDANGDPIVEVVDVLDNNNVKIVIKKFDVKSGKFTNEYQIDATRLLYENPLMKGKDGYDFYYATDSSIYGFKYDGATATKIVNFNSSNINGSEVNVVDMLNADEFVINSLDFNTYTQTDIKKYTKVDPSLVSDKSVFTLATLYSNDSLKNTVIDFNESQSDIKIELVDYSESADPVAKLSADIAAGTTPDFYEVSDGIGNMSLHQSISKGMLEDITPFMENDTELSKDDFIPSAYNAMLTDGKLYYVGGFIIPFTTMAKTSEVGKELGWNFAEVKEILDSKPENTQLMMNNNKIEMFDSLSRCCMSDFIDWDKGECYFNSDDFKAMLEICNRGTNEDFDASYVLNYNEPEALRSGKQLIRNSNIDPYEIANYKRIFGEEITYKGYPNKDQNGTKATFNVTIGMSSQCENKEAAWSFLRYILSKEYQGKNYKNGIGVPVREDVYAAYEKSCTATESYTDEFGNSIKPQNDTIESADFVWEYKPVTKAELDDFRGVLDSISGYLDTDEQVMKVVDEEVASYFSGDKSVDDICVIIQDRVHTYINENK